MKRFLLIFLTGALIFTVNISISYSCEPVSINRGSSLKYDFDYLYKWTASVMKVDADPQKMPYLVFVPGDYLQNFFEKLTGTKPHYYLNEVKVDIKVNSFYWPSHKTVYMGEDLDPEKYSIEGLIVHEIVHSIQHLYLGFTENNERMEYEAQAIERQFCSEHDFPVPLL